jgi:2-polyprenyl-6-methoxyphenol hydroxylase-like FAD-dependent oxidoreductase
MGAGLAGLAAALAFARRGRSVLLLERDSMFVDGGADRLFHEWDRPGITHFRQPHNFWALSRRVLSEEAPEVLARVLDLGATENLQYELLPGVVRPEDEAFVSICARRPVFEYALRHAVDAEPGVRLRPGTRVVGLLGDKRGQDGVRVTGVRTHDDGSANAPLVVDALGRTSPVSKWLEELGCQPATERRSECGLLYYSRHFRFRDGVEMPRVPALHRGPRGELGFMAYSVFVEDNRTFCPVLMIPPWDRQLRALKSEDAYMATAMKLPALVSWVHPDQAEPITPVLPMGSLQNLQSTLIAAGQPVATGIQPVGDALCHTNPTFAYGASLSLDHGFTLARIATETTDPGSLAVAFDEAVGADAAARFDAVSAEDRDRLRLWQGEPIDVRDPGDSMALFLRMTAYPAAARDPDLFRAVARRVNLLDPPDALARDEELIARARELAPGVGATAPAGPTRQDVLDAIAQVRGSALYSALASRLLGEHPRQ